MTQRPPEPVLVVGTGLVGTSVGLALRARDVRVHLRDSDPSAAAVAAGLGAGDPGPPDPADGVGMVVVAVPPARVADVAAAALSAYPSAVVSDVASVKAVPLAELATRVSGSALGRYVGGHPMAGSEQSGPLAGSAALFEGRAWAVTPHPSAEPASIAAVEALAGACGALVVTLSPDEHDRAVARVSHLPHLLSVLAAAQLVEAPAGHLALAGQGLRDVTRVAAGDPALWRDILASNASALRELLRQVRTDLDVLLAGLDTGGGDVTSVLGRGLDGTRRIPAKHGGLAGADAVALASVRVSVPDQPGELARLFADAGQSGVNVEDLRIDHDPGRATGVVELVVQAAAAEHLVLGLAARGWSAHR